jgi:hypothetical protein
VGGTYRKSKNKFQQTLLYLNVISFQRNETKNGKTNIRKKSSSVSNESSKIISSSIGRVLLPTRKKYIKTLRIYPKTTLISRRELNIIHQLLNIYFFIRENNIIL